MYAFHALRMAESYIKRALYVTESEGDLSSYENRINEYNSSRMELTDVSALLNFFDPIHDIYDYHNTAEYMSKST
jgi:hypothetical protein